MGLGVGLGFTGDQPLEEWSGSGFLFSFFLLPAVCVRADGCSWVGEGIEVGAEKGRS